MEKGSGDRYFSGFIATYQPKWVSGLSLGLIQSFVVNRTDMARNLRDYLPVLKPTVGGTVHDRYSSMFFRWAMPAAKLEFYSEYGRNLDAKSGRKRFIFNVRMQYMHALNYEPNTTGRGKGNLHMQLGMMYRF